MDKKCVDCDSIAVREYDGEFRCEEHHLEAKRIANAKFEKNETLKKYAIVIGGIIVISVGAIVIYQFVSNL
jgi:hypothetical protein